MRASECKTTAANLQAKKANAPYFGKEGRDAFFSQGPSNSAQGRSPFFSPSTIQPKLTIGQPGDKYEQEADAMADQVVQRLAVNRSPLSVVGSGAGVQRKCAACAAEDKEQPLAPKLQPKAIFESNEEQPLQRKCTACQEQSIHPKHIQMQGGPSAASSDLESRLSATKGGGSPLPKDTRGSMESAFGADFSGVRVHTGSESMQMNQELGAQAFTHGSDVYFNQGKYDTGSGDGQRLLAHELTHVVQQNSGSISRMIQCSTAAESLSRIQDAASGWGTDEEEIFNAIRECTELEILKNNPRVKEILNDELSGYDLFKALTMLRYGPETNFPSGMLAIWEASDGMGTDEELIFDAIRGSTDRTRLKDDPWVTKTLRSELSGFDYAKAKLLLKYGTESAFPVYIRPLWRATDRMGTDEDALFNTLISLSPTDLAELKTNSEFVEAMRDDLSGSDLSRFDNILDGTAPEVMEEHESTTAYGANLPGPLAVSGGGDIDDFSPNDVNQGFVGDCYFLATLAAIAQTDPSVLRSQINGPTADGSYNVTLYVMDGDNFVPQTVNVTPSFPELNTPLASGSTDVYARGGDSDAAGNTELWVRLYEKAYAKLRGTYETIDGGWAREAMQTLLGQSAETLDVSDFDDNTKLFDKINTSLLANTPVAADTISQDDIDDLSAAEKTFANNNGIVGRHSYAVLSVSNTNITLYNPHGVLAGGGSAPASITLTLDQFRIYYSRINCLQ